MCTLTGDTDNTDIHIFTFPWKLRYNNTDIHIFTFPWKL